MNMQDRIRDIARRLLEKSKANQVAWSPGPSGTGERGPVKRVFVRFPASSLLLAYITPPTEFDILRAVIIREDGVEVGWLEATEDMNPDDDWKLLKALWDESQRCILGWDKVLEDIEKGLQQQGKIG